MNATIFPRLAAALLAAGLYLPFPATAGELDPALAGATAPAVDVIVHLERSVEPARYGAARRGGARTALIEALRADARAAQAPLLRALDTLRATNVRPLWLAGAVAARVPTAELERLAALPGVRRVAPDRTLVAPKPVRTERDPAAKAAAAVPEWNLTRISANLLWSYGIEGQGRVVAVLDTGVDVEHQDLADRWRGGASGWLDPHGQHATPGDVNGHGTQVASLIVGGSAGGTAIGVAPAAQWIAAKIYDDAGRTSYSVIHQALQWALDPDGNAATDDAADVVNNSWGFGDAVGQCIREFEADIDALRAAGIAVVFSAGNSGPAANTSLSPACNSGSYAVGATDLHGYVWQYSSRGPSACDGTTFPVVTAPGVDIRTADLTSGGLFPDAYTYVDGTSYAAAHVAGGFLLLAQAFPAATLPQLEWALKTSAFDRGLPGPDNDYGAGIIRLGQAYDALAGGLACTDDDGDGRAADGGVCGIVDCDDTNPTVWSVPGEVTGLAFDADRTTLRWSAAPAGTGVDGSLRYDTLRSRDASNFVTATTCLESAGEDTVTVEPDAPDAGMFAYLVRAVNACPGGAGTAGTSSDGMARNVTTCP